jgi:hypothetical protein
MMVYLLLILQNGSADYGTAACTLANSKGTKDLELYTKTEWVMDNKLITLVTRVS